MGANVRSLAAAAGLLIPLVSAVAAYAEHAGLYEYTVLRNGTPIGTNRVTATPSADDGFIVWDFAEQEAEFVDRVSGWIREGRIKYREDFVDGLENAPKAFQGLLQGHNFGKLVVSGFRRIQRSDADPRW